ncbi:MFS transporter [Actinacidiphila oryziradicis]|uniref:MFS transporter n=1 Tax=Actinacidiphila oryziradicis TaxID=2571141 RepID=A0A4U0T896_9ACTN|nr:MFS transporter [Actinacidiphila oryziradicis]TKA10285.1 MFS transporter [Actinacidiphila oryziradicis]
MDSPPALIRTKDDVVRVINESADAPHSRMIGFIALGGFFLDAYDFTSLSAGSVQMKSEFGLSASQLGLVTAVMAFGAIVGALSGGYFVDRFGRLRMFIVNLLLFVLATLGAAFAPDYETLIVLRLLIGIGVGLDVPVAMAFLVEFMAMKKKAKWVESAAALWSAATICGLLVALLLNALGAGNSLWRWEVGLGALPAVVILLLRFKYMAESPMWAATKGDLAEAARILSITYARPFELAPDAVAAPQAETPRNPFRPFGQLFTGEFRKRTILISVISAAQSVQFSSVGFYLPLIVFSFFHSSFTVSLLASVFANACGLCAALLAANLADRLGLRRLTVIGFSGVAVVLIVLGLVGHLIPPLLGVVLLAFFIGAHTFGPGSTAQSMSAMSYPTRVRGVGAGLSQASNRTGSLIALYGVPVLLSAFGLYHALLILLVAPAIGLIVLAVIKWEPVGNVSEDEPESVFGSPTGGTSRPAITPTHSI